MAIKRTGSLFKGLGSAYSKFSGMQRETYDLAPKIAEIKKNMEKDRIAREQRMKTFNAAVSLFSTGMQNLESQKGIDIGQTLTQGTTPDRNFMDNLNVFFGGPSGDPMGQFGAVGQAAGNQNELEKLLEIFGNKGTIPNKPDLAPEREILPTSESKKKIEDLKKIFEEQEEFSDFRFSIFN